MSSIFIGRKLIPVWAIEVDEVDTPTWWSNKAGKLVCLHDGETYYDDFLVTSSYDPGLSRTEKVCAGCHQIIEQEEEL